MHAGDNNDRLVQNYAIGALNLATLASGYGTFAQGRGGYSWIGGELNYDGANPDNTNTALLVNKGYAAFASYIQTAPTYKCSDDPSVVTIGSTTLPRVRSYSLNDAFSVLSDQNECCPLLSQVGTVNKPGLPVVGPSDQFCFLDEHPDTIFGGEFCFFSVPTWFALPAHYHDNSSTLSFADGHVGLHRWMDPAVLRPVTGIQIGEFGNVEIPDSMSAPDVQWMLAHTIYPWVRFGL